jgi:DNA mismatch endonuclease (patch repair protein)
MADVLSPSQRRYCMSRIRGKDTKPEWIVRKGLFALGFRYRLHVRSLPGCPDLVFPRNRAVIFVHGCLWHRHECKLFRWPKTNARFWREKLTRNSRNDARNIAKLRSAGWRVLVVWECRLRRQRNPNNAHLIIKIAQWTSSGETSASI